MLFRAMSSQENRKENYLLTVLGELSLQRPPPFGLPRNPRRKMRDSTFTEECPLCRTVARNSVT